TKAVVDGQVRARTPTILREEAGLALLVALRAWSGVDVLAVLGEICVGGDGGDAAGEHGVDVARVGEVGVRGAREVRGIEHAVGGVGGIDAHRDGGGRGVGDAPLSYLRGAGDEGG